MVVQIKCWAMITMFGLVLAQLTVARADTIDGLVVVLVDEATIVAAVEGPIAEVTVEEGQTVAAGEVVAKLDDHKMRLHEQLAEQELVIAVNRLDQSHGIEAAKSVAETERLKLREQAIRLEMERQRAANELKVLAAEKAEAVAKNEWERAREARQNFSDAVSESEIEALQLAFQRSELETREARFQNEIAKMEARLAELTSETAQSELVSSEIAVKQAESSREITVVEVAIKRLMREMAKVQRDERSVRSPIAGQMVSVLVRPGDWVRPGEVVARVIGTARLRAEGFMPARLVNSIQGAKPLTIIVTAADGKPVQVTGERRFVSPEIDPITNEVRFWVEFSNLQHGLRPGCRAMIVTDSN